MNGKIPVWNHNLATKRDYSLQLIDKILWKPHYLTGGTWRESLSIDQKKIILKKNNILTKNGDKRSVEVCTGELKNIIN